MPAGRTHDLLTLVSAAAATPLILNLPEINALNYASLVGAYLGSSYLFSNDLDLSSNSYDRWGPLRFIWYPYQRLVPHRSRISHGFVIGPLLRVVYFISVTFIILYGLLTIVDWLGASLDQGGLLQVWTGRLYSLIADHPVTLNYFLIGFVLSGALHTAVDLVTTMLKRRF